MPRRRTVMLVPPHGARVKTIRAHGAVVVVLALVLAAGFAGYFIPFTRLALDRAKLNEKRNLERINEDLLHRIVSTRTILKEVRGHIGELDTRRRNALLTNREAAGTPDQVHRVAARRAALLDIGDMPSILATYEQAWAEFAAIVDSQPHFFADLPVMVPLSGNVVLSARFGKRVDPFTGTEKWHTGVDLVGPREAPVLAAANGVVADVENDSKWGKTIRLRHGSDFTTVYAHLGSMGVKRGARVKRGQKIGTVGASGLTTGPHLHYEIHHNGVAVDPERYFYPTYESSLVHMSAMSLH